MAPSRGALFDQPAAISSSLDENPLRSLPGALRRVAAALLLGLLLSRAGRFFFIRGFRRRTLAPRRRVPAVWEARAAKPAPGTRSLRFKPTVSCWFVPNLCYLTEEKKTKLWWRQQDFASFLKTRVELGRAYTIIAKKRGVAVGSAFPPEPALAHESRRGLGLGRKKQRDRNRQRYIKAVIDEQLRQRRAILGTVEVLEGSGACGVIECLLDAEMLAQAAQRCSESDRRYAVAQAREDYERTLQAPDPQPGDGSWSRERSERANRLKRLIGNCEGLEGLEGSHPDAAGLKGLQPPLPGNSFSLSEDQRGPVTGSDEEMERYVSPSVSTSKGFGLSRDDLEQAGLSATGHLMSRRPAGSAHFLASVSAEAVHETGGADLGISDVSCSDTGVSDCGDTTDCSLDWDSGGA